MPYLGSVALRCALSFSRGPYSEKRTDTASAALKLMLTMLKRRAERPAALFLSPLLG